MVEGECIHIGNLIPKTALLEGECQKARKKLYGNQISRGMVKGEVYTQEFDSQNGPFELERSFTGIKFQEVW